METRDIVTIALGVISLIIPTVIFAISSPKLITPANINIFGLIIFVIILGFVFLYLYSRWRELNNKINRQENKITEIDKSLNFYRLFSDMEARIKSLEYLKNKEKKGQIDPRIIIWIILLILIYLFLKSTGIIR